MNQREVSTFTIALLMIGLVIGVGLSTPICYATEPEDLPWSNETDVIILPWSNETDIPPDPSPDISPPSLPPFYRYFKIEPTEIMLGEDLAISFVIENPNNKTITRMSTTRIGDFFTQIIEIRLEAYESKHIYYRIIPHVVGEYDVWIDGQTGTFKVISTEIIIVVDPLEDLSLRIDYLDISLDDLNKEIYILWTTYNDLQDADANLIERYESFDLKLTTEIEQKDDQIQQLDEKIELLDEELSRELKRTRNSVNSILIMFGLLSAIAIGIVVMKRRP